VAPVLGVKAVCTATTLSRSTIYRLVQAGHFPKPLQLSPRRVGYREAEVLAWIVARTPRATERKA
jgi:prophage regulatory protein